MTKEEALDLIKAYESVLPWLEKDTFPENMYENLEELVLGMHGRFPEDGSTSKAMRWLGFVQGVMVASGVYSLYEVKMHSKDKEINLADKMTNGY